MIISNFDAFQKANQSGSELDNIRIKNVIIPIAIANPSSPNNFNERSVAKAVAAILAKLFPKLTLDIIRLGLDFSL